MAIAALMSSSSRLENIIDKIIFLFYSSLSIWLSYYLISLSYFSFLFLPTSLSPCIWSMAIAALMSSFNYRWNFHLLVFIYLYLIISLIFFLLLSKSLSFPFLYRHCCSYVFVRKNNWIIYHTIMYLLSLNFPLSLCLYLNKLLNTNILYEIYHMDGGFFSSYLSLFLFSLFLISIFLFLFISQSPWDNKRGVYIQYWIGTAGP